MTKVRMYSLPALPISKLHPDWIKDLENDPTKPLEREWESLEDILHRNFCSDSFKTSKQNYRKNRYADVLANENTRVLLQHPPQSQSEEEEEESNDVTDYINANWVDGMGTNNKRAYIATQGPLQHTINDFLCMLWQESVSTVVMLSNEMERGRVKCQRYWPNDESCPIETECYKVSYKSCTSPSSGVVLRQLKFENKTTQEIRDLIHLQYITWPDHGVPSEIQEFLDFVDIVDKLKSSGPLVIHCSAGLGRSGVFIVVHSTFTFLKQNISSNNSSEYHFDMGRLIQTIREQRHGMVQTFEQYQFCWQAIANGAQKILSKNRID